MNSLLKIEDEVILNIIKKLKDIIQTTKFEGKVFLADEFVSNAILGRNPTDIILAIEMEQGARRFGDFLQSQGYTVKNALEITDHDVLRFNLKDYDEYEITCSQTRKGKLGSGGKDESLIYGTLHQDAMLRCLTINSIYYNISEEKIVDPTNKGLLDIVQKKLRTPAAPYITFLSDPINMVKIIRISGELDWGIAKTTWLGIVESARRLKYCDMEAFSFELANILSQDKASKPMLKLAYSGLLEYCLPEIDSMSQEVDKKTPDKSLLLHTLDVIDKTNCSDLVARFAALFHDYGKLVVGVYPMHKEKNAEVSAQFAELTLKELKLGSSFITKVLTVIMMFEFFDNIPDSVTPSERLIRKFSDKTDDVFVSTVDLIQAENTSVTIGKKPHLAAHILKRYEDMLHSEKTRQKPNLPINGKDIMAEFNVKGKIVGDILEAITDAYYDDETLTKDECFSIAEDYIRALLV